MKKILLTTIIILAGLLQIAAQTGFSGESGSFTVDTKNPVVSIIAPNGGGSFNYLLPLNITWSATDDSFGAAPISAGLSTEEGGAINWLGTGLINSGTTSITPPQVATTQAKAHIKAVDAFGNEAVDGSDGYFELLEPCQDAVADAGPDATICEGQSVFLAGSAQNYQSVLWETTGDGTFANAASLQTTYYPGQADVWYGYAELCLTAYATAPCADATDCMYISFEYNPWVDAGPDATICEGEIAILYGYASYSSNVLWTTSGDGTFDDPQGFVTVYAPGPNDIINGSVFITMNALPISPCNLTGTDSMELTIIEEMYLFCEDFTVCIGDGSVVFWGFDEDCELWGPGVYWDYWEWGWTFDPNMAGVGTHLITLSCINQGCNSSCTMVATVLGNATANAGADATICQTQTKTLSGSANNYSSLLWTTSGNGTFNNNGILNPVYTHGIEDMITGIVVLTLTAAPIEPCAAFAYDELTLTIEMLPLVNIGTDQTICEDQTVFLSGIIPPGTDCYLTKDGFPFYDDVYTPTPGDIQNGSVEFCLHCQGDPPCDIEVSDCMTVFLIQNPEVNAGADQTITAGMEAYLSPSVNNFSSVEWITEGDGSFYNNTALNTLYTPGIQDFENGSVQLQIFVEPQYPCMYGTMDELTIFCETPIIDLGPDETVCEDVEVINLPCYVGIDIPGIPYEHTYGDGFFSGSAPFSCGWSMDYTPGPGDLENGFVEMCLTFFFPNPQGLTVSDCKTFYFQDLPSTSAGADATICQTATKQLSGSATNYSTLLWTTSGNGTFGSAGSPTTEYIPGSMDIENGTVTLTLTVNALAPCAGTVSDAMVLTIQKSPTANAGADATICQTATKQLSGTASNYSNVLWTTSGNGTFSNESSLTAIYTPGTADIDNGSVSLTLFAFPIQPCSLSASDSFILYFGPYPPIWEVPELSSILPHNLKVMMAANPRIGNIPIISGDYIGAFFVGDNGDLVCGGAGLWQDLTSIAFDTCITFEMIGDDTQTPHKEGFADGETIQYKIFSFTTMKEYDADNITFDTNPGSGYISGVYWHSMGLSSIINMKAIETFDVYVTATPNPICVGGSSQLNATVFIGPGEPYTYSWTSNPPGFTSTLKNPFVTPNSTTQYLLTAQSGALTSQHNVTVIVNEFPIANAGDDGTVCGNQTYQLSGSAINYSEVFWTTSGSGTFSSTSSLTPVYTPGSQDVLAGQITLSINALPLSPCGFSSTDLLLLTVLPTPIIFAGEDKQACSNDQIILIATAQNYGAIQWTTSGTGYFTQPSSLQTQYLPSTADIINGAVTLTVCASSAQPCVANVCDALMVSFLPGPTASAPATKVICENQTANLTGSASNYSSTLWTTAGDGTFNNPNANAIAYTPGPNDKINGVVTLTFNVFPIQPCTTTATKQTVVTVKKLPVVNAGTTDLVCKNTSLQLYGTASGYNSLIWSTLGDGYFSSANILNPIYFPGTNDNAAGTFKLVLKGTASLPCSLPDYDTLQVTIVENPLGFAGIDATICQTETHQLSGTAQNYSSVLWTTSGNGTFSSANSLNSVYTPGTNDITAGTVTLTLTASAISPCTISASDSKNLTIQKTPTANAGIDATICQTGTHQLSGTAQNQSSVLWTTSGNGTFSSVSSLTPVYTPSAGDISAGSVNLTLIASSISPCTVSSSDFKILTIQKIPVVNSGSDATICQGSTHTLAGAAQNQSSVFWTTSGNGTFSSASSLTPVYTPGAGDISAGSVNLTLIASSISPCTVSSSDFKILTIQKTPVANAGDDALICFGEIHAVSGSIENTSSSIWETNGNGTFDNPSELSTIYHPGNLDLQNGLALISLIAQPISPCVVASSDFFELTVNHCQDVAIPAGWSGVSSYVQPFGASPDQIFGEAMDDLIILQSETGMFWPGQNVNTIGLWNRNEGYKIKATSEMSLHFAGNWSGENSLNLAANWNIVPVLSECATNVENLFSQTDLTIVKEVAGWRVYWPAMGINSLEYLDPGKSYFVKMQNEGLVFFPECDGLKSLASRLYAPDENLSEFGIVKTASTHIIALSNDLSLKKGSQMMAFDELGLCVGVVEWKNQSTALTVFGDDPLTSEKDGALADEILTFKIFQPETGLVQVLSPVWSKLLPDFDGLFHENGLSLISDINFNSLNESGNLVDFQIFPNPAKDFVTVVKSSSKDFQIEMINQLGESCFKGILNGTTTTIDVTALKPGVFMVIIFDDNSRVVKKLIID